MENAGGESLITKDLLRKIELQKTQLELNVRFEKNMALFKKISPVIFTAFENYRPEELRLSLHPDGYVELVNFKLNNKPVYPHDPKLFAEQQVAVFKKKPMLSNITLSKSKPYNPRHFHLDLVNEVIDTFDEDNAPRQANTDNPIGLLIMTGCGLGYQIEELINRCDVYGLCLFDPHKDSFYASLHTIDWAPILEHFSQTGRMIKLCIGMTPEKTLTHLKLLTDAIGLHNIICSYIYRHFNSTEENAFIDAYKKQFHLNAFGLGYYDDEQTSLAHSVSNIKAGISVLKGNNKSSSIPAFIIGNGPSLDTLKDFLKENQNNAILFSCGTALGSLHKMGIKPDFHVEMERTRTVMPWVHRCSDEEFRQGITLLALNTVYPGVFDLFENRHMALKANDLGLHLIKNEMSDYDVEVLNYCNPTVTNCALSYAKALGLSNIYLIGVDLGIAEGAEHHSKVSPHYALDKDKIQKYSYSDNQYSIPGNFSNTVSTTPALDSSRVNIENFISAHKDITVYNPNNGAKIKNTTAVRPEDLPNLASYTEAKGEYIQNINENFYDISQLEFNKDKIYNKYIKPLYRYRKKLHLSDTANSAKDIYLELNRVYSIVKEIEAENPTAGVLIRGSINTFLGFVSKYCLFGESENQSENYHAIKEKYHRLLKSIYDNIKDDAFRNDDTRNSWEN